MGLAVFWADIVDAGLFALPRYHIRIIIKLAHELELPARAIDYVIYLSTVLFGVAWLEHALKVSALVLARKRVSFFFKSHINTRMFLRLRTTYANRH
jgi:hypothetical protein